jgi:hypothetical protein
MTNLEYLMLDYRKDGTIFFSLSTLTNLTKLDLGVDYDPPIRLSDLKKLPHLASLCVYSLPYWSEASPPSTELKRLQTHTDIPHHHLWTHLTKLRIIEFCEIQPTLISRFTNLTSLDITPDFKSPWGWDALSHLTNITSFSLTEEYKDEDIPLRFPKLRKLNLASCEACPPYLSLLSGLESLEVSEFEVPSGWLDALSRLTSLRSWGDNILDKDLPVRLRSLTVRTMINGPRIRNLSHLTALTYLMISHPGVLGIGLAGLTNLTSLHVRDNRMISDVHICKLSNLTELRHDTHHFSNECLEYLPKLKVLLIYRSTPMLKICRYCDKRNYRIHISYKYETPKEL